MKLSRLRKLLKLPKFAKLDERTKKIIFFSLIIILFIFFSIFFLRTYLNIQLILGYDVLIDLNVNNEYIVIQNNDIAEVSFITSVRTNPFCSAYCTYTFRDLKSLEIIESSESSITLIDPLENSFTLTNAKGEGARLYRYEIECKSERTFMCRTKEHTTSRHLVVTFEHTLNDDQRQAKQKSQVFIEDYVEKLSSSFSNILSFNATLENTKNYFPSDNVTEFAITHLNESLNTLNIFNDIWISQDYVRLHEKIINESDSLKFSIDIANNAIFSLNNSIEKFNIALFNLNSISNQTFNLDNKIIFNHSLHNDSIKFLKDLNGTIKTFDNLTSLEYRVYRVEQLSKDFFELNDSFSKEHNNNLDWFIDNYENVTSQLCNLINCTNYNFYFEISSNLTNISFIDSDNSIHQICSEVDIWNDIVESFNQTQKDNLNVTIPNLCFNLNNKISSLLESNLTKIEIEYVDYHLSFGLQENYKMCCVSGDCKPCCDDGYCNRSPILFLHGHAIDSDSPPDFNMDTFNAIQHRLEDYGIISMGRISMYRFFDFPENIWGQFGEPMSLKISYYYDVYTDEDSSIIIPTKNDNLDTYAVRLNDIVNTVLAKTGADDVIIIAHSMGGLVTRRYMQIFGISKVDKVMTTGSPHHGITGWVSTFCPLFGERLECRDMREDSLFINKLNREPVPDIKFYNVVAVGCETDGKESDGVVLKRSAMLDGTNNIILEGTCEAVDLLHTTFVRDLQPEFFEIVKDFLVLDEIIS